MNKSLKNLVVCSTLVQVLVKYMALVFGRLTLRPITFREAVSPEPASLPTGFLTGVKQPLINYSCIN